MANEKTADAYQEQLEKKARQKKLIETYLPYFGLVFLIVFFTITCGSTFVDINNLQNLINQCFTYVIVAAGASFIYATGAMDMSVGTVVGMGMFASAVVLRAGLPWPLAIVASMAMCIALEVVMSAAFQILHVPVFVVSLCMMYLLQGVLQMAVKQEMTIDYYATSWLNGAGVKVIVLIIVLGITYYLFHKTKFGAQLRAIGSNRTAADQAGIRTMKTVCMGFAVLGACVGVAGFFSLTRAGYTSSSSGSGIMLNIMISIVLGGNPLTGGSRFKLVNSIIGALMVTVLSNGLTLMGLAPALVETIKGILYLIIVFVTYDKSKGDLVT